MKLEFVPLEALGFSTKFSNVEKLTETSSDSIHFEMEFDGFDWEGSPKSPPWLRHGKRFPLTRMQVGQALRRSEQMFREEFGPYVRVSSSEVVSFLKDSN